MFKQCVVCLEDATVQCTGPCERGFCKQCFASPVIQRLLQPDVPQFEYGASYFCAAKFLCQHCSQGTRVCYRCFKPVAGDRVPCSDAGCAVAVHRECYSDLIKSDEEPQCPLHRCTVCHHDYTTSPAQEIVSRPCNNYILKCVRCLRTAHMGCNQSPLFKDIGFSSNMSVSAFNSAMICKSCQEVIKMYAGQSYSSTLLDQFKAFRLDELTVFSNDVNSVLRQSSMAQIIHESDTNVSQPPNSKSDSSSNSDAPYPEDEFMCRYRSIFSMDANHDTFTFHHSAPRSVYKSKY